MCGLVRISFLFSLEKKIAAKNSAQHKNGCAPSSPLQAGMSVSVFCAPLPWAKPVRRGVFFSRELLHKTKHTVTCSFYCQSASVEGMVHILCHGHSDGRLPSFSSCSSAGSQADSHHVYKGQCVQLAEY